MLRTFFDFRRVSTLIALVLIIALAAIMFASAPAETQTAPADATATPTATVDPDATATPTVTGTATATATPTATVDPDATATPTATATGTATATATATPTATPTVPPANADYDVDNDGLIEIRTLPQLNAVRYDIDGDGKQGSVSASDWATYTTAFLNAASGMGCPQPNCTGYELMMDLNFDTDGDGDVDASDTNSYPNWTPIGAAASPFNATFKGKLIDGVMPKISNLTISGASTEVGLFGATGANARIESVGLVDVNVNISTSARYAKIGALVGNNLGKVTACYSTGKVNAAAGGYSEAGGLVGYNGGAIAAAFSRATVSMSSSGEIYVGGLVGYNAEALTATYAAGAVKGKGGSGYVGGLVGYNIKTITASYSIAPVTAVASVTDGSKPEVRGLSYNEPDITTITSSYWDYIASGIDDDAGPAMPEGKSTYELLSPISAAGIYAGWNTLTIDGASNVNPWEDFNQTQWHPRLTYGGHTTKLTAETSGNQRLADSGVGNYGSRGGASAGHPREGITLISGRGGGLRDFRAGLWIWESSTDGIDWTTIAPLPGKAGELLRGAGGTYGGTYKFVPRSEHVGKYIRSRLLLTTGDYLYTRVIGKIRTAARATDKFSLASGHNPPRIGTAITVASMPSAADALWYRCDTNDSTPTGCEMIGSLDSYIPGAADLNHYIHAHIYYNKSGNWTRANTDFTQKVADVQRAWQWR